MNTKEVNKNKLWTKNFTIITLGSVISMLGNSIAGFAQGLLILDCTKSTFLYALFLVVYNLPKVIVPTLAGPLVDRFSRKRIIYSLDFTSVAVYITLAFFFFNGWYSYPIMLISCLVLGSIDGVYTVAFQSLYPMLISEGNYTKAYSVQSTLETLTMVMVPVSAFLYNLVGIVPLFLINAGTFLIAAIFETKIEVREVYAEKRETSFGLSEYKKTFMAGMDYLKHEKGLAAITLYFVITMFANASMQTLQLPYFKSNYHNGEYIYIFVMGFMIAGRLISGAVHYKFKYPVQKKFMIAMIVYSSICILDGTMLFFPIPVMMLFCLSEGFLGMTSYNIRIAATQSYVPDEKKGRYNGFFNMMVTMGMMIGQFLSGACGEVVKEQWVIAGFLFLNLIGVYAVMYRNRREVKKIYNREQ